MMRYFCNAMQSTLYHMYQSIEGNVDQENPNILNKQIDKKENKNLQLFICFNLVMLTILVTMMLLGYDNVPDSNGRQFLLVSSIIIGVFILIIIVFAILMTNHIASLVFFTICTFYTIVHSILAIVYIIFFFFYLGK